jgi:tetratricopeptide (TPR) repeat protein
MRSNIAIAAVLILAMSRLALPAAAPPGNPPNGEMPPIPQPGIGSIVPLPSPAGPELETELPAPHVLGNDLQEQLNSLRLQRQALKAESQYAPPPAETATDDTARAIAQLRRRASELMLRACNQKQSPVSVTPPAPPQPVERPGANPPDLVKPKANSPDRTGEVPEKKGSTSAKAEPTRTDSPQDPAQAVDSLALGQALFRTGDFEGALMAFRALELKDRKPAERLMVEYLAASCLRKLGRTEEAATLYREIGNAKGDAFLSECAQWQLEAIRWRREVESELDDLRKHRQNAEPKH